MKRIADSCDHWRGLGSRGSQRHPFVDFATPCDDYIWMTWKQVGFLYDNDNTHGANLNRTRLTARYPARVPVGESFELGFDEGMS
uniref:CAZy families GH13 protein n=1 Tax=Panagrellus redivivus TaxID=6233 RepID=A0A7E4UMW9_PANRE